MRAAIVGLWLAAATLFFAGVVERRRHDPEPYFRARVALAPPLSAGIEVFAAWMFAVEEAVRNKDWKKLALPENVQNEIASHAPPPKSDAERLRAFFEDPTIEPSIRSMVGEACGETRFSDATGCVRRAQSVLSEREAKEGIARRNADRLMLWSIAPAVVGLSLLLARSFSRRRSAESISRTPLR